MENTKCKILNCIGMAVLTGVLTLMGGCSSDDGGGNGGNGETSDAISFAASANAPDWKVDWMWHDEMPDWQNPSSSLYEERMYVTLKLDEGYVPYSTENDRMAIFIDDECRGVSERNSSEFDPKVIIFPIMVHGSRRDVEVGKRLTVKYYCDGMKQIFTNPGFYGFSPDAIIGDTWDQVLLFGSGGSRYTGHKSVVVRLGGDVPFTPSASDRVAAFVNGECRGSGLAGEQFDFWLTGHEEGEKEFQVRYYSCNQNGIYTLEKPIQIDNNYPINVTFNF